MNINIEDLMEMIGSEKKSVKEKIPALLALIALMKLDPVGIERELAKINCKNCGTVLNKIAATQFIIKASPEEVIILKNK